MIRANVVRRVIRMLSILSLFVAAQTWAGIGAELKGAFDEMSNSSTPQEFATVDRKGYWGGSYQMRSKVVNLQLAQVQLPSVKAGCGGINMTGGSFSFVNQDQLVQLFRQVASGAKSYAFQLAMDAACPSCTRWMNEFQAKIQAMTSHTANSCQLAQGIVNIAADTFTAGSLNTRVNNAMTNSGLEQTFDNASSDFFKAMNHVSTAGEVWETPIEKEKSTSPTTYALKHGNVLWNAMVWAGNTGAYSALGAPVSGGVSDDYEMMENIVSMVDTIVVRDGKDERGNDAVAVPTTLPRLEGMSLKRLVMSTPQDKLTTYNCIGNKGDVSAASLPQKVKDAGLCMIKADSTKEVSLAQGGMAHKVVTSFMGGSSGGIGIIDSMAYHKGLVAPDPETLKYLKLYDPVIVEATRLYAKHKLTPRAQDLINKYGNRIALDVVKQMVDVYLEAARQSLSQVDLKQVQYVDGQITNIKEAQKRVNEEYDELLKDSKNFADLADAAQELRDAQDTVRKLVVKVDADRAGGN